MTYLEDGRCSFSNNLSENAIRPFTVGRRNWLFSDTPKGAEASAIVYTMVEMAKAHGLNIYKYLNHLLEHLPETRMRESELSRLAPWAPEIISRCSGAMQSKMLASCKAVQSKILAVPTFYYKGLLYFCPFVGLPSAYHLQNSDTDIKAT